MVVSIALTPLKYWDGFERVTGGGVSAQALGGTLRRIINSNGAYACTLSPLPSVTSHALVLSIKPCKRARCGKRKAKNNG